MKKRFILTGFGRYSRSGLLIKARTIISSMTGNGKFATPNPTLAAVSGAADAYENALSQPNSKAVTVLRNQCAAILIGLLNTLAEYVQANSFNDEGIMLSSGFDVNKLRTKVGVLPAPGSFRVTPLLNGAVKLRVNKVKGAKSYLFEYALSTNGIIGEWQIHPSSKSYCTIRGLISGSLYSFRVAAVGADPVLTYSQIISSYML